ncbi:MAG: TRAP transporter fused permease subunit, partial [Firmicutes bacterium]|nr:TRAP transporter fused permease subunit [Bacillota bacterium]
MPLMKFMEKQKDALVEEALKGKHRTLKDWWYYLAFGWAVSTGLYHIYTAYFGAPFALLFRNIHWMLIAVLIFLFFPAGKKSPESNPSLLDIVFIIASLVIGMYVILNFTAIAGRAGAPVTADIILGALLVLIVLEAGRRTVGWPIVVIALIFLAYAYFGQSMPGLLMHRGYSISRIFPFLYLTDAGIFGIPLGVSSRFILLFIIFGSFLEKAGAGIFFRDLSLALTGRYIGGPGKAAILFSGFIGSITGSSTANVVTTGTFTIPLMKKLGYKPAFAAGVEADASTGGQILPPVMGAAAFVMAEYIGVPYVTVMVAAIIPALLYFITSFFMVHYRALKENLRPVPKDELPKLSEVMKNGFYYFTPLLILIVLLVLHYSPSRAVFWALLATIALSWIKPDTRMGIKDIVEAIYSGVQKALEVVAACAVAGVIIGIVTMT